MTFGIVYAAVLVFDGVLGRSGEVGIPLVPQPSGVEWKASAELRKSDYTNLVGRSVLCAGRLAETGELLVCTDYPEYKAHLFGGDGAEVFDAPWPVGAMFEHIAQENGLTWGLGNGAVALTRKRTGAKFLRVGGPEAQKCRGIVSVEGGWWLLTRQGWLFYDAADPARCVRRHGCLKDVTALALLRGKVYVFRHSQLDTLWLDNRPDEPFLPFGFDHGRAADRWTGTVDAAEAVDGRIRYAFSKERKNYILDPSVTSWVHRKKRQFRTDEPVAKKPNEAALPGSWRAEADGSAITLVSPDGAIAQTLPVAATILAAEGRWLVAYIPAERAIFRYWFNPPTTIH